MSDSTPAVNGSAHHQPSGSLRVLMLGALGVVFGDIGTSPLYALKTTLDTAGNASPETAYGMFSLIVWTLIITTSIKYVALVMRADNQGEGGILALMANLALKGKERSGLIAMGILGAALLYGDGAITPAISVLSALEGLETPLPGLKPFILPIAVVVLLFLFILQRKGTAVIGKLFGPVMIVWFLTLGVLGLLAIVQHPEVLWAVNPLPGLRFLVSHGYTGFTVLGAVFLCATGAEALYADMGHFGARPIRMSWYVLVLPMLLLNYAGQTALVATGQVPQGGNPFFLLGPDWMQIPLVVLATAATIIASQAIISGVFSMTRQAIQLGLCPRLNVTQTSETGYGQIYVGVVNWLLMVFTVGLALSFKTSDNLAAAYGIAVALTMLLTSMLMFKMMRDQWKWPLGVALLVAALLIFIDTAFVAANLIKVEEGGWVPLVAAALIFLVMEAWRTGRIGLLNQLERETLPLDMFIESMAHEEKVEGTAVYLARRTDVVPVAMLHSAKHFHVIHRRNIILHVETAQVPRIGEAQRAEVKDMGHDFFNVVLHYGFMQYPDILSALKALRIGDEDFDEMQTSFFLSRVSIGAAPAAEAHVNPVFRSLFSWLHKNETDATEFFGLPRNRIVELGARIEM